mgnify:CR=1 FL=1
MAFLEVRRGRKQVSPGLLGFRLGQKRDKLNKPYLVLELFPGRIFMLLGIFAVVGYFSAALALYMWREKKLGEFNAVTYSDILLGPFDRANLREQLGKSQIAYGMDAYDRQEWREAFSALGNGLRRYPADQKAIFRYAGLTFASGNTQNATDMLIDGLQYGYPESRDYLILLFHLLQSERNLPSLERAAEVLLTMPEIAGDPARKYGIQKNLLLTMMMNENYLGAYNLAEEIKQDKDATFLVDDTIMLSLTKLGRSNEAIAYAETLDPAIRNQPAMILLEASAQFAAGHSEKAIALLERIYKEYPTVYEAQRGVILFLLQTGNAAKAEEYLNRYMTMHYRTPGALPDLAVNLTDFPSSTYVKRVYDFTLKVGSPEAPSIEFLLAQAYLTEGKFDMAIKTFEAWEQKLAQEINDPNVELFRLLIINAKTPAVATEDEIMKLLETKKLDLEMYWETANAFCLLNRFTAAVKVADMAVARYPHSPTLIAQRKFIIRAQQDFASGKTPSSRDTKKSYNSGSIPLIDNGTGVEDMEF